MRISFIFAATVALAVVAGCNTVMEKSYQRVAISTPEVEGVDCTMDTGKLQYHVIAPGSTIVERSPYEMTVTCEKANYFTASKVVKPRLGMGWTAAFPPGLPYDAGSRSIYDYPDVIEMEMAPNLDAMAATRASLTDPVSELKKKAVPATVAEEAPVPPLLPLPSEGEEAVDKALYK